jgi:hypothetical protein
MSIFSKIFRVFALVIAALCCLLGGSAAISQVPTQENTADMNHSIDLIVRTDHMRYSREDSIQISASLRNEGNAPIYIDRRMFWTGVGGGLGLEILDDHGKHLPARVLSDAMMPPLNQGDASILIRLDEEFFYGTSVTLKVKEFFPKPGRYSIRVIYKSQLRKESVVPQLRNLPVLWEDTPYITSKPTWVDVTQ